MKNYGSVQLKEDVLDRGLCIGCGACISLCPYLRTHRGRTAMLFPCTQESGRCYAFCPKAGVDLDAVSGFIHGRPYGESGVGPHLSVHASRAGDRAPGSVFQSGGTVSALVAFMLERGIIDAAILTGRTGLLPEPRIVTDPGEVASCATSKYAAAPTLSALQEARDAGFRKIGLVGTPCQILASAQIRMHAESEGLPDPIAMTIGLFCTWALDFRKLESILKERTDIAAIDKIDIPPPPAEVMEIYGKGGTLTVPLGEIRTAIPAACAYCTDMTAEFADVSVGMLEGTPGMNTLIVRTSRGDALVRDAAAGGFLKTEPCPAGAIQELEGAAEQKRKRATAKASEDGLMNPAGGERRPHIRLAAETQARILS
ncbi:MAG: Coenzyme F420 hydrogenase/dehydrogenase, beta subunit C-terminal domain [Spirochaetes bacterium]|nr:Coenzyme F420 hydrogenase/dehydrogenase, beta subunit C-terminal domain [Spirochaetota bacterium]